jgi:hypothetical protein
MIIYFTLIIIFQDLTSKIISDHTVCLCTKRWINHIWDVMVRVGIVDVWPSWRNCGCVAFVPYMCRRPLIRHLSCRFWKPPCAGEVLPKFCTYSIVFFVLQSRTCRREPEAPRLVSTVTLGIIELFSLPLLYVDRCSPVRCLPSETDTVGDMRIFLYFYDCICFGLSTFFGQPADA